MNPITVTNTGGSGTATLGFTGATSLIDTDLALNAPVVFTSNSAARFVRSYMGQISGAGAGAGSNSVIFNLGAGNWLEIYPKEAVGGAGSANTFTGNLLVQSGNLEVNGLTFNGDTPANQNLTIPATASVTVNSGAVLQFVWGDETFDALNGGGTIQRNTGDNQGTRNLTIGVNGGSGSFSGTITSDFSIIKAGSGTQTFTGANNYTGSTTISGGTLAVNGSIAASSLVSVSIAGTLSGDGSVSKLSGAGLVAPGGGEILTGTQVDPSNGLAFTFRLTLAGAPIYSTAAASGNDLLHLTNATTPFTLSLTAANVITVDFSGATLAPGQTYFGGFFLDAGVSSLQLSNATFAYTGLNGFSVLNNGLVTVSSAAFATGTVTNGQVMEFTIIAVPEPGSASLALLGGLGLLLRRRKRNAPTR
jgi:autotransporter-associated beta strand protein